MSRDESQQGRHRPPPWSEGFVDRVCAAFAIWTVASHAVVLAGGNLLLLISLGGLAAALAFAIGHRLRSRSVPAPLAVAAEAPEDRWRRRGRLLAFTLGPVVVAATFWGESTVALWWCLMLVLGAAAVFFLLLERPALEPPARGLRLELGLWALALLSVAIALVVHRPNSDDAFYINLAAAAADMPAKPILQADTLHGVEGLPMHLVVYKAHSFEMIAAALSYLSGVPAVYVFHIALAAFGALLLPLAFARLFRLLTPAHWLWAVAALLAVLVSTGEVHRWYGNFALVRIWQGKAFYLFVFLPLIYAYGIRFALRPGLRAWLLLWAAQVAALGCSSSAVWAAPLAAMLAVGIGIRLDRKGLYTLAMASLSTFYCLAVGWKMKPAVIRMVSQSPPPFEPGYKLYGVMAELMGQGRLLAFGALVLLVAWACRGRGMGRRFAIGLPLAVGLLLLNPYTFAWVKSTLTGPAYWRGMWSLPLPILMVMVLISPLGLAGTRIGRPGSRALTVAALVAYALWIPSHGALEPANDVALRPPGAKTPALYYRLARKLNDAVPAGSMVVAPTPVGTWVPVFQDHAYPMMTRRTYLERFRRHLGSRETDDRVLMTRFVSGARVPPRARERFEIGLDLYRIQGVCVKRSKKNLGVRRLLVRKGFERLSIESRYEIWTRSAES